MSSESLVSLDDSRGYVQSPKTKRKCDSASAEGSNKRAKNVQPTHIRHSNFWAADGSVVLQIDMTKLKVHQSRLAAQSEWFEKLFAHRQGRSLQGDEDEADITDIRVEGLEGLDLFHLDSTGVTLADFEALLNAMDEGIDFYMLKPSFTIVAAIYRAASIFHFRKYLAFATAFLEAEFSDKLEDIRPIHQSHAAEAVVLGRDWNLPRILKCAFYELVRASFFEAEDDSAEEVTNDHPVHTVEPSDLVRLANLQKRLALAWASVVNLPHIKCNQTPPCASSKLSKSWEAVHGSGIAQRYYLDPIYGITKLLELDWKKKGYCTHCQGIRSRWLIGQQARIWDDIDTWLGLDP